MLIHFGEASSIFKQKYPKSRTFYTNFKQKTICRLVGMLYTRCYLYQMYGWHNYIHNASIVNLAIADVATADNV